jgi:hypothetical protein
MKKSRLLKLADLLDENAANKKGVKFYYYAWGWVKNLKKPMSCKTTACALGLAAISGRFKRVGLGFTLGKLDGSIGFMVKGRPMSPLPAAKRIFGLTSGQAEYIFAGSGGLPTPSGARAERAVAKRIREFVRAR